MKISGAKVFVGGRFIDGGIAFSERIEAVGPSVCGGADAHGCYLIPGLVDVHTHAALGEDASDGSAEGMVKMSRYYAAEGVTSWCPTTMTLKEPELTRAMHTIRDFVRPGDGAKVAGIHLEGPFLNLKKCGAQNPDNLHAPDAAMFARLNEASGGLVRLVTVAPEEPDAMAFIRAVSKVCTVSIGHTTASYDVASEAYAAGASHATHLFNAMPPLAHREPGVIAAAMDAGATVELIPDGSPLRYGEIGVFLVGNTYYIKQYEKDGLHSLNSAYSPMLFDADFTSVYLIGRVLGVVPPEDIATPEEEQLYLKYHPEED